MSEAKHTPGPWGVRLSGNPDSLIKIVTEGPTKGGLLAEVLFWGSPEYGPTKFQAEANARLIAAAPALLASCLEFIGCLGAGGYHPTPGAPATERMRAAIAKATP